MSGELRILNCSAGDIRVKIDKSKPDDIKKAKTMINDMLKRGYLLAIEVDGELHPVKKFDPDRDEYIITEPATTPAKRGGYKSRRVAMDKTKAIGVPRTAGG